MHKHLRRIRHCGNPDNLPLRQPSTTMALSLGGPYTTVNASNLASAWNSRIGGISFVQTTDGNKPTLSTLNSMPALVFDGAASRLTSTATLNSIFTATNKTMFVVQRPDVVNKNQVVFNSAAGTFGIMGTVTQAGKVNCTTNSNAAFVTGWPPNVTSVLMPLHNAGALTLSLNGTPGDAVAGLTTQTMTSQLTIGDVSGWSQFFDGYILEIIAANAPFSTRTINQIYKKSLSRKYL